MYEEFNNNFKCYLKYHSNNLSKNKKQLDLLEPFYGLCNYETYENWKLRSDMRYYEASNLVYQLTDNMDKYPAFQVFYQELCDHGFDARKSEEFKMDKVESQLKMINLLLGPAIAKL